MVDRISSLLTAILFKTSDHASSESLGLPLIYLSLVLSLLALVTAAIFVAVFDGQTVVCSISLNPLDSYCELPAEGKQSAD